MLVFKCVYVRFCVYACRMYILPRMYLCTCSIEMMVVVSILPTQMNPHFLRYLSHHITPGCICFVLILPIDVRSDGSTHMEGPPDTKCTCYGMQVHASPHVIGMNKRTRRTVHHKENIDPLPITEALEMGGHIWYMNTIAKYMYMY